MVRTGESPDDILKSWDDEPAEVAWTVIDKDGEPDDVTPNRLI